MNKLTIIQDTKEKEPWNFLFYDECKAQVCQHLETGDYTAAGYEKDIVIERKHSTGELATNLGIKYEQFRAELERMVEYKYRYVICEFTLDDIYAFPANSGIPRTKWGKLRMNGRFIAKRFMELCEEFGVEIIFCRNKEEAEQRALMVILQHVEEINKI